jgi:hypothetical protein
MKVESYIPYLSDLLYVMQRKLSAHSHPSKLPDFLSPETYKDYFSLFKEI